MATDFGQNLRSDLYSTCWHFACDARDVYGRPTITFPAVVVEHLVTGTRLDRTGSSVNVCVVGRAWTVESQVVGRNH